MIRLPAPADASSSAAGRVARPSTTCAWCSTSIPAGARADSVFCSKKCRQTAWRLGKRGVARGANERPIRVAYADPPYPGCAWRYYRSEEVDHRELVARLVREFPDGWALSTSMDALVDVLPLCPAGVRVCTWVKPHPPHAKSCGIHNCSEALIVYGGRQRKPGVRDWLCALPARSGGTLPGRKPLAFVAWLFALLGVLPGDELVDLFPGTGIVGRAFRELHRSPTAARRIEPSRRRPRREASPPPARRVA